MEELRLLIEQEEELAPDWEGDMEEEQQSPGETVEEVMLLTEQEGDRKDDLAE